MDPGRQFQPQEPVRAKRKHPVSCQHCASVTEYHMAREAAQVQREGVTGGYKTETQEYGPIITFKDWLVGSSKRKERPW